MEKVSFIFTGKEQKTVADDFYTWFIDGGLQDQLIDFFAEKGIDVDIKSWDNDKREITVEC